MLFKSSLAAVLIGLGLGTGIAQAQVNPPVTQCTTQALAGGTADALTTPALPCVPTTTLLILTLSATNTTTTPTLKPDGAIAQTIVRADGSPVAVGELGTGSTVMMINTGSVWKKLNGAGVTQINISANNGITLTPDPITGVGTVACTPASSTLFGCVPASGGGTTNYLDASFHWSAPPGFGTVTSVGLSSPGGIFGITGTNPITGSGTFGYTTSASTGDALYFSSPSQVNALAGCTGGVINWVTASSISCTPTPILGASGTLGALFLGNNTSGLGEIIMPPGVALGSVIATLPAANTDLPIYPQFVTYVGPTAARTVTYPDANFTAAALDVANQAITGGFNITSNNIGTISSGTLTVACGTRDLQYFTNNGAFTLAAGSNDGSCAYLMTNGASAGAVTLSGFTLVGGVCDGATLDTTNAHVFKFYFTRINGISDCAIKAYQ